MLNGKYSQVLMHRSYSRSSLAVQNLAEGHMLAEFHVESLNQKYTVSISV